MKNAEHQSVEHEMLKLGAERDKLVVDKKENEAELSAITNRIRSHGHMAAKDYKSCCDLQTNYKRIIVQIDSRISQINTRMRELGSQKHEARLAAATPESIIRELVKLRETYQQFAADSTRVSSMRTMAAEFVVKLNPIIKNAINRPAQLGQ